MKHVTTNMKVSEIKRRSTCLFFDPSNMRFFGDTMNSFRTIVLDGVLFMYRRPEATVNVFGTIQPAGREFFNAWKISETTEGTISLETTMKSGETQAVYEAVTTTKGD